jgi:site-specific DNA recombinase
MKAPSMTHKIEIVDCGAVFVSLTRDFACISEAVCAIKEGGINLNEKLRFAPLVRVSTEAQEKRGESLRIQTDRIESTVKDLGGVVSKWYKGQEHSTPDSERKILDELLEDAGKGKFDAVIVDDFSRWSRDNLKSEQGIRILKKNSIRFFVGRIEYDLHDPNHKFLLTSSVSLSEMYGLTMAQKSLNSKIDRLKLGKPCTGSLPWGRTWDREKERWGIDPKAAELIKKAADMFLSGTAMEVIAEEVKLSAAQVYKLLGGIAGDKWTVKIRPKLFPKMEHTETLTIPSLLPKATMTACEKKLQRGRAFFRGDKKNSLLLTGVLFCGVCGYSMSGVQIKQHWRYYMHQRIPKKYGIDDNHGWRYIPAELLENAVMKDIIENFGDAKKREELFTKSNGGAATKARKTLKRYEQDLKKVQRALEKLVDSLEDDSLPMEVIKARSKQRKAEEAKFIEKIESLKSELASIPTKDELNGMEKALSEAIDFAYYSTEAHLQEMTFNQKRDLLHLLFGSAEKPTGANKKAGQLMPKFLKSGIYVERTPKGWKYRIKGSFPVITGKIGLKEIGSSYSPY